MVRSGKITESNISISSDPPVDVAEAEIFDSMLKGKRVHDIQSFDNLLRPALCPNDNTKIMALSSWLSLIFGNLGKIRK